MNTDTHRWFCSKSPTKYSKMIDMSIKADRCFHIKLGRGDEWSKDAINEGRIYFGYQNVPYETCQTKDASIIRDILRKEYPETSEAKITDRLREIMTFYTEPEMTLWITFYNGHLYYATARENVLVTIDGKGERRYRETTYGWSCSNVNKEPISEIRLRGDLVTKKYYRGTICSVPEPLLEYLLRVINCEEHPIHQRIREAHREISKLIARLGSKDFELLIDMIMQRSGLLRETPVGGTMKDIDYAGSHPLSGRFYYAQVKSRSNEVEFSKYLDTFKRMDSINSGSVYMYFINEDDIAKYQLLIEKYEKEDGRFECQVLGRNEIGELAAKLGLMDWILDRT